GVGIVLEVLETSPGDETGEGIQVAELLRGWHRPIMTNVRGQGKEGLPAFSQVFQEFGRKTHPIDIKKRQLSDTPSFDPNTARFLTNFYHSGNLAARPTGGDDNTNRYAVTDQSVPIPGNAPAGAEYLLFVADAFDVLAERDGNVQDGTDTNNVFP